MERFYVKIEVDNISEFEIFTYSEILQEIEESFEDDLYEYLINLEVIEYDETIDLHDISPDLINDFICEILGDDINNKYGFIIILVDGVTIDNRIFIDQESIRSILEKL